MTLLSVEEALKKVTESLKCLPSERISLAKAHKRVLAQDIAANVTQPPFNASAMDGYAVTAKDIEKTPVKLDLVGESSAGHSYDGRLENGRTVRIFTGAPVPEGADTVVMQENVSRDGDIITINQTAAHGSNIRPEGNDFSLGDILLNKGQVLGAKHLALAAAMNVNEVSVVKRPIVAVLATGDELVEPGGSPNQDQIISSIPIGLTSMIESWGGETRYLGIARDNMPSLNDKIQLSENADILVTIGGASVGDHDLVQQALKNAGMDLNFWKVAMRPGKPLMYGELKNRHVLGLPGNPISAFVGAYIFLSQMVAKLSGQDEFQMTTHNAVLDCDLPENGPRQHYMRATRKIAEDGRSFVTLANSQDSSLLATFAQSNCLIIRPPHAPAANQGETTEILIM